ncbi:TPA: fimbrial protein [Klebsiella quasipneumoniae subsp. similipneumoniae]
MSRILLVFFSLLILSFNATANCVLSPDQSYPLSNMLKQQMPIGKTVISVPPDTPVGTEILRQTVLLSPGIQARIACDNANPYYSVYKYAQLPLPASQVSIGKSGRIYETGVKGIGIMFWYSANGFPYNLPGTCTGVSCGGTFNFNSDFSLYKIGDVEPGVISSLNLPVVRYAIGQSTENSVDVLELSLTGNITVTTPTCQIAEPNKVVHLGRESITSFTGKGSATSWKDATIQLINCPVFYGNTGGRGTSGTWNGSTINASSTQIYNSITLTLNSSSGVIDAANGILDISDIGNGTAAGIGIQLSTDRDTSTPAQLAVPLTKILPTTGDTSYNIPLFARYIQTEDKVTSGIADGLVTYTLEYK